MPELVCTVALTAAGQSMLPKVEAEIARIPATKDVSIKPLVKRGSSSSRPKGGSAVKGIKRSAPRIGKPKMVETQAIRGTGTPTDFRAQTSDAARAKPEKSASVQLIQEAPSPPNRNAGCAMRAAPAIEQDMITAFMRCSLSCKKRWPMKAANTILMVVS